MTSFPIQLAGHAFWSSMKIKIFGTKRYKGKAEDICRQIVDECWNGVFFQTSTSHFRQFWTRDFGWCVESLLKRGYRDEVEKTLGYALEIFSKHGAVTTTISPDHAAFDFPVYAVDSLPWLVHSLAVLGNRTLVQQYAAFLEREVERFVRRVVDEKSGLVKPQHFSSMKDLALRKSSCYDNCMVAFLFDNLKKCGLRRPLYTFRYNYTKIIKKHFWNGAYFYDDMAKKPYIAGDANIFPFYTGIFSDRKMLLSALEHIQLAGLDRPFPLKYTSRDAPVRFIWSEWFLHGYEKDAVWTHMALLYIELVRRVDVEKATFYMDAYRKVIETNKNYLEVFASHGRPFRTVFYHSDQGMLWAANYLTL